MCKTWRSELGPNAEVSYQKSVVSAVPAKNSIDHKERFIQRGASGIMAVTEEAQAPD